MKNIQNILAVVICSFFALSVSAQAQITSTSHIFPQVADGVQGDGTIYNSFLYVTNLGGASASCTLSLYGMSTSRFVNPATFTLANGFWTINATRGLGSSLASGYARLNCSQPVYANLIYALTRPDQTVAGMATVFSSPLTTYALLPALLDGSLRYGFAIANDNSTTTTVSLLFTSNGQTTGKQIPISPRSQLVGFVDQYLSIPSSGAGTLEILSQSGQQFSVVGLLFSGSVFTTLVPSY